MTRKQLPGLCLLTSYGYGYWMRVSPPKLCTQGEFRGDQDSEILANCHTDTILTAFPRRWGRNNPDPSAVHRAVRDHLAAVDTRQITSIYELALIIIDECSKVFFDRTKPDLRPE